MNSIKEWKSKVKEYNSELCKKLENESTKKEKIIVDIDITKGI